MPELRPSLVSAPDRSRKPVFRWVCLRLRIAGVPDPAAQTTDAVLAGRCCLVAVSPQVEMAPPVALVQLLQLDAVAHARRLLAGPCATRLDGLPMWPCGSGSAREEALGSGKGTAEAPAWHRHCSPARPSPTRRRAAAGLPWLGACLPAANLKFKHRPGAAEAVSGWRCGRRGKLLDHQT